MHNSYANFVKIPDVCKIFSKNLVNELGNVPRAMSRALEWLVPKFSDLEVIALNLTVENMSIDSESHLFALLEDYRNEMPNLISRRQYNDRRKITAELCETIRKRIVERIDGRRTGNLFTNHLLRSEKGVKPISRSSPTSSTSCETTQSSTSASSQESSVK